MKKLRPPLVTMDDKTSYMLEHPEYLEPETAQVGTISREVVIDPSETTRWTPVQQEERCEKK